MYNRDCPQGERKTLNQTFAKALLLFFLLSGAVFNIAQGRKLIRAKKRSTALGWARVVVGALMGLLPFPIFYYFLK